jgi:hypothetical protein
MPPKIKSIISKLKKNIKKNPNNLKVIKDVVKGRDGYPESVKKILSSHGDDIIIGYSVKRTPVSKTLTNLLSIASQGEFNKRLNASEYDELFHLYLEIKLQSGKSLLIEKNAVINITPSLKRPKEEIRRINTFQKDLSLNIIMNNTQKAMGSKFFPYSANNNNCQHFIESVMKSNKIGNLDDISFVKQDTKFLFENLPYLRRMSNTVTTIGARVDNLKNLI